MERGTDYLVGRAVSQIWSACKREASSTPALVHLSLCALLLRFPPAWGLDGQLSGIREGKTGSVEISSQTTQESPCLCST